MFEGETAEKFSYKDVDCSGERCWETSWMGVNEGGGASRLLHYPLSFKVPPRILDLAYMKSSVPCNDSKGPGLFAN